MTPKTIQIRTAKRTRKCIEATYAKGDAVFGMKERDNPLPGLGKAFDALAPLVATICHLPAAYAEDNLRVIGIVIGEQSGADTVSLVVRKGLDDAAKEFSFTTPARLLAHPKEEGTYTPPLSEADAALVWEAVEQVKGYIKGERAQGQIAFEGEDEEDNGSGEIEPKGEELPFPSAPEPAKKRGRKPTATAAK